VKALLCLAILTLIGRQFALDLARPQLWLRPLHVGWLALSGVLYLLALGMPALFWGRLLGHLGYHPPLRTSLRAFYVSQLGKYMPGKAWALLLRAWMVHGVGVGPAVAGLTSFYEVLTTMCGGALMAALFFGLFGTGGEDVGPGVSLAALLDLLHLRTPEGEVLSRWTGVALALLLAVVTGGPLLPAFFNRIASRLVLPFRERAGSLPHLRLAYLGEGLCWAAVGWLLMGASVGAALRGVAGPVLDDSPVMLARLTAAIGVAYVAGFLVIFAPGGLGAREFFLALLLTPELAARSNLPPAEARALVVLTVLVLRLVWTLAEVLCAFSFQLSVFIHRLAVRKRNEPPVRDEVTTSD
jgi:hypothetical protein